MNSSGLLHRDADVLGWGGHRTRLSAEARFPSLRLPCLHARPLAHSANQNKRNAHSIRRPLEPRLQ